MAGKLACVCMCEAQLAQGGTVLLFVCIKPSHDAAAG